MWGLLARFLRKYGWHRRRIEEALEPRGEARKDGLLLTGMQHRLEICWQARDVHPWDRQLPAEARHATFIEQALLDTEAAIARLFESLPEVDLIGFRVTDPQTDATMLSGSVHRYDFQNVRPSPSVRMRLTEIGVVFEALEIDYSYQV